MTDIIINQSSYSQELLYIMDGNQDNNFNVIDIVSFIQLIVEN